MRVADLSFSAGGTMLAGRLFAPKLEAPAPAVVVCHGAGESKENYEELCRYLAGRGIAALAIDMHGHGASGGKRYSVDMSEWVAAVRAAVELLAGQPEVDPNRIGAFGLSSGGTAILEAALVEPRLKALVTLAPTVRDSLPLGQSLLFRVLRWVGWAKRILTGQDLEIPLERLVDHVTLVADPEIELRLRERMRRDRPYLPLPSAFQAFVVDTIERVKRITAPVRIIWGEHDQIDPVASGRELFAALACEKSLEIIAGNGHATHLDKDRERVYSLAAGWVMEHLGPIGAGQAKTLARLDSQPAARRKSGLIVGDEARALTLEEKWSLFSPHLKRHGGESLAYATLQAGMEYYVEPRGYLAFTSVTHPVFARKVKRIVLSDPICSPEDRKDLIRNFLALSPRLVFSVISEGCADTLHELGFKVNCAGYESLVPVQTYNTQGNWKELDLVKRARNEARREGITIREVDLDGVDPAEFASVSSQWISGKRVNDREIWI
jgi:alpha-beta hydrolase superfamily lysophospholipase